MSSSQPVATPNALNFTPDNKHCYAYTGVTAITGTEKTLMEFNTNSEYLVLKLQPIQFSSTNNNILYFVLFNDVKVQSTETTGARDYTPYDELHLIVPPFTHVKIRVDNLSGGTDDAGLAITGRAYGMADVGYQ